MLLPGRGERIFHDDSNGKIYGMRGWLKVPEVPVKHDVVGREIGARKNIPPLAEAHSQNHADLHTEIQLDSSTEQRARRYTVSAKSMGSPDCITSYMHFSKDIIQQKPLHEPDGDPLPAMGRRICFDVRIRSSLELEVREKSTGGSAHTSYFV